MANWKTGYTPKCEEKSVSREVLVTVGERVLKAIYVPYHHCTLEDMAWNRPDGFQNDDWEYCEEEDSYWIPQGWYEVADNFEDVACVPIDGKVLAWDNLPKAYEPKIKELTLS